ncbi:DM10 domain [Popillia japonica]|uniref:DM10 domain n=1 Tax=Popillia japonica TaxID=7064 RepID=A0AAW1IC88_POPJA
MAGLPKLPGYNFTDPTITRYHLPHAFDFCNGYKIPRHPGPGIGGQPLDIDSVGYIDKLDPVRFDPSLTYGRTRSVALPQFLPHFALYDQKCLTFKAFFKQSVSESPMEHYRVRQVNIIYFLEDDTITVMEPSVENSGLLQGRLIRRHKIPKTEQGDLWHWKDLDVGKDICFYGVVFHTVDCDTYTREYMASQGLIMGDTEQIPPDPYTQKRIFEQRSHISKTPTADDKLRRFLEYDGKILKFKALWDDRDSEYGEIRPYEILYFLADDTVSVKEVHDRNDGRDPFPQLLRKTKLPKVWTDRPATFASIYLERSDAEVTEYYQPKDFLVGDTVFVLGRRMFLYDCDDFTRNYFRKVLCIEQKPSISIEKKKKTSPQRPMPPHDGLGSLEDSLQNTITFMPKPPRKDVLRQVLNTNKYLRYEMKLDVVHPEDTIRRFLLNYSLADGTCSIYEPPIRNSGIIGGKYLRSNYLKKPGCDPLDPDYYTAADFYIGAIITVFQQRFIITGADLYVYRYMQTNSEKFPCEIIENIRNYMFNQGLLNEDIDDRVEEDMEREKKERRDAIGKEIKEEPTDMEKCMAEVNIGADVDSEYEKRIKQRILAEYEASIQHKQDVPPHGIQPVEKTCRYPIHVGDVKSTECSALEGNYELAPKHIDTPAEIREKYYSDVLRRHEAICTEGKPIECSEPPKIGEEQSICDKKPEQTKPIMVHPLQLPEDACKVKTVKFAEGPDRCVRDRYDLCDLNTEKTQCDCTDYKKC